MLVVIEEEAFDVENTQNFVGAIPVDRHSPVTLDPDLGDDFLVREGIGNSESIDARGHAVFDGFVAQFDDLLDHFPFADAEFSFFHPQLHQGFQFFVIQVVLRKRSLFGEKVRGLFGEFLQGS